MVIVCDTCGVNVSVIGHHAYGCPQATPSTEYRAESYDPTSGPSKLAQAVSSTVAERTLKMITTSLLAHDETLVNEDDEEYADMLIIMRSTAIAASVITIQVLAEQGMLNGEQIAYLSKMFSGDTDDRPSS